MQGPPNIVFLAETLALPKTKGELWLVRPGVFWLQAFPKGVMVPAVRLGPAPVLDAPELELLSGAVALIPDSPQSIGVTDPPKAKGRGAALPNTEPQAPFPCVWATAPNPVVPARPKGNPAGVLPELGKMTAGRRRAETEGVNPARGECEARLKAG